MAVTLKDIAIETGVNIGSISNVLNDHPKAMKLRVETREKILKAADALGYHCNEMARAIVTNRSRIIAFVAADMGQISYTGRIQEGVFEEASDREYTVSFFHLIPGKQQEIIRKIKEWKIAGAVFHVADSKLVTEIQLELNRLGIPYGMVNLSSEEQAGIGRTTDDFQGVVDVMKHLSELGHRRIAHLTLTKSKNVEYVENRLNGYLEGMKQFSPESSPEIIKCDQDSCVEICEKILSQPKMLRPTAVFCVMDTWAMILMRVAIKLGVKVPEELSIVGFGNLDMSEFAVVPLTTVLQPFQEMGRLATSDVIDVIEKPGAKKKAISLKIKADLVIRESTTQLNNN